MQKAKSNQFGTYVAEEDHFERLEDGRRILVARKGVEMTIAEAASLGLIKNEQAEAETDEKAKAPTSNKKAGATENK